MAHTFSYYVYGHLFDTLQKLYYIKDLNLNGPIFIVNDSSRISSFSQHIAVLGYDPIKIFTNLGYFDFIEVPNLIFSDSPSTPGQFTYESYEWIYQKYILNRLDQVFDVDLHHREYVLFLDRTGVGSRNFLNSEEILQELQKHFDVIVFNGSEDLKTTTKLFYNAKYIVGAHGAMFVNTIFSHEKVFILEFFPHNRQVVQFMSMCKKALNHIGIVLEANEKNEISLDPKLLVDMLKSSEAPL